VYNSIQLLLACEFHDYVIQALILACLETGLSKVILGTTDCIYSFLESTSFYHQTYLISCSGPAG